LENSNILDHIITTPKVNFKLNTDKKRTWVKDITRVKTTTTPKVKKQVIKNKGNNIKRPNTLPKTTARTSKSVLLNQSVRKKGTTPIVKVNKGGIRKLDIIIISVNYNDYLITSLSHNTKLFNNITVVTSTDDVMCQKICDKFKVKCVITDRMYDNGAKFNKGKAINDGIKSLIEPDYVLLLDADILVSKPIDLNKLSEDSIYTSNRWICKNYTLLNNWMGGSIPIEKIGQLESNRGFGFFQLFNIKKESHFPESSDDAAWSDLMFRDKFTKRDVIPNDIIHVGDPYINWEGRKTNRFLTDDQFNELFNKKSTFTICSYYFNFRNDIRQKNNFIKFLKQFEGYYDNMVVGLVDYGDIDFEIPCKTISIKGDVDNKVWSKEILINKIVDQSNSDYILWIDGDIIYENLDWLNNLDYLMKDNDFLQLFETINYLDESGKIIESHKSIASNVSNDIDTLLSKGLKPGGSWMSKSNILKSTPLFDKMWVGGGDTILTYGLYGIENGWTLNKVREGSEKVWLDAKNWITSFGKRKVGYLPITINHLYHGDLKDRDYNERYKNKELININSHLPEFGYELISSLPYCYSLYKKGKLGDTISGLDTTCLYFFNSGKHTEVMDKRGWHNMPKLCDAKFPNIGIHTPELDMDNFLPPPLKEHYESKKIVFEKETIVICNRYNLEWGDDPINFIDIETLKSLFILLKDDYQIVYINLKGDSRYYDDAPPLELGDFDLIKNYYKDDVIVIQDLFKDYDTTFNDLQMRVFAGCSKFVTSNGGQSILTSYFGGENIIFTKKCREILPEINSFYRWYHKFGNSIIKVVNTENELIEIIKSKWVDKDPLINILIRTSGRPNYFKDCIESIYKQKYKNWNIIVGCDDKGSKKYIQPHKCVLVNYDIDEKIPNPPNSIEYGIKFKYNLYINELQKYVFDGYIMYLDDDDILYNNESLTNISNGLKSNDYDLAFYRVQFPNRLVPSDENFKKQIPIMKDVSGLGFIFKNEIKVDWTPYKRGDYRVAKELNEISKKTLWLDKTISSIQRTTEDGFGKRDDK
jgi:hypothetical protein